jgi:ApaG protein
METIYLITNEIKISVEVAYQGHNATGFQSSYLFAYRITIENMGDETVQLINRHWKITDGFGQKRMVDGAGVIGQQPVLNPKQNFRYSSNCPLVSEIGSMEGNYEFENLRNGNRFFVAIPRFMLIAPQLSN